MSRNYSVLLSILPILRQSVFAAVVCGASAAYSGDSIVIPTMPGMDYVQTEVSTNIPINRSRSDIGKLDIDLEMAGTPTNNLQLAFGIDANDNGDLEIDETDMVIGWRAGRYVIEDVKRWKRLEETAEGRGNPGRFVFSLEANRDLLPRSFTATCGGTPAFTNLTAEVPSWLYNPNWNLMKATRRSLETPSDWIEADFDYKRLVIIVR